MPSGRFSVPALPPGIYAVKAELAGFATQTREGIVLQLGTAVAVDFTLRIAGTREEITVSAAAPLIDTQQTAVSTVVSQKQIESLPINGRNFISFSIITPGVSTDRTPQQGASATSGLTFAGQRARSNNITVDGLDNNDAALGSVRATFSQEAVREFQVLTNSYSAEFGKASGGVVNIVTKSGTNTPSGNAFFYGRDDALNRKGYFEKFNPAGQPITQDKAPYSQKQFGATLGGPMRKDRTFFFGSFERLDVRASNFVTIDDTTRVPGPAGGFLGTPAGILRAAGFPVETGNIPYAVKGNQFLAKVDHQISPTQGLVLRFNYADTLNENIEPFGGIVAKSRAASLDAKDYMAAASHTAVSGPSVVNELRFQFARRDQTIDSLDPNCGGPCARRGPGRPHARSARRRERGSPAVHAAAAVERPLPGARYAQLLRGQPPAQVRLRFQLHRQPEWPSPAAFRRALHFRRAAGHSGSAARAGQRHPGGGARAARALRPGVWPDARAYAYKDISLFAQDDWRVTSNLTLKLGVRYQDQLWPDVQYNVAGFGPYAFPKDHNNVAPRLSVAWDPTSDQKTSVHASYGIFYDNHITSIVGITDGISGGSNVRTFVAGLPTSAGGVECAGTQAAGAEPRRTQPGDLDRSRIGDALRPSCVGGDRPRAPESDLVVGELRLRARIQSARDDRLQPDRAVARRRPAAGRRGWSRRHLGVGASVHDLWRDVVSRPDALVGQALHRSLPVPGQLHLVEGRGQLDRLPERVRSAANGTGTIRRGSTGLPVGFTPDDEKGPSLQDQRHRFVLSGLYVAPGAVQVSSIVTVASGRPYNILAGADLNGDGDGGTSSPDRARRNPGSEASSIGRNTGVMPYQATVDVRVSRRFRLSGKVGVDGLFEVFNLFNRTNFVEINNIFGTGAYPGNPLPTFGQFIQAAAPLQVQLAAKILF